MQGRVTFQGYYHQVGRFIRDKLDKQPVEYLLGVDPEDYLDYLVRESEWQPLEWHRDEMEVEVITEGQEQHFRLHIPITPHHQLDEYLRYGPSTYRLQNEPRWTWTPAKDAVVVDVPASKAAVDGLLADMDFWLGNRNRDIEEGNRTLRATIEPIWRAKRERLEAQHGAVQQALQSLNIPLRRDPNAAAQPVEVKPRVLRTAIAKPVAATKAEPTLLRDDVLALVDFIEQYARQFEVAPRTYSKLEEEELRDLLVGMLNANYPGSTTAETFSKLGKTDISLRVEGGHVLVCECKFWSGANAYSDALDQLFRYLTWRQTYGVLITFCTLRDMTKAVAAAQDMVRQHPTTTDRGPSVRSETRFSSRHHHPQDEARSVEVHHLFFDLSA